MHIGHYLRRHVKKGKITRATIFNGIMLGLINASAYGKNKLMQAAEGGDEWMDALKDLQRQEKLAATGSKFTEFERLQLTTTAAGFCLAALVILCLAGKCLCTYFSRKHIE